MRNNKAHTLVEILVASTILVLLFAFVLGAFVFTKGVSYFSIAEYNLQRDANILMGKIIRGMSEQGGHFGLRSSASFILPVTNPAGSEIDFVGTDARTRKYFLSGRSVVYESPFQVPVQKSVFTAAADAGVILRFWEPAGYPDHQVVGIYISISRQMGMRTVIGSLTTYVSLKNMPK